MHTAGDTGASRPDTTTAPAPAIPPLDNIHRGLWRHLWADRSPENKAACNCSDASRRLRGLGDILVSIGMSATESRHELHKFGFLAETVFDIAAALDAAHDAIWRSEDAAEKAEEAEDRASAKKTKRRRKGHGRRAAA
jgi:hypothetical protein